MSMRRTDRRSFWPVFMAVFMSSCNRANRDMVAPDIIAPDTDKTGLRLAACHENQRRLLSAAGHVSYLFSRRTSRLAFRRVVHRAKQARRGGTGFVPQCEGSTADWLKLAYSGRDRFVEDGGFVLSNGRFADSATPASCRRGRT